MREIKFRAWDKKSKMWVDNDVVLLPNGRIDVVDLDSEVDSKDIEIFLFTGEKDKNGKEIFEGGIVKFPSKLNNFIHIDYSNEGKKEPKEIISEVRFSNGFFSFNWMYGYEGKEVTFKQVELIGNICENPELLK